MNKIFFAFLILVALPRLSSAQLNWYPSSGYGYLGVRDNSSVSGAYIQGTSAVSYFGNLGTNRLAFGNSSNWEMVTVGNTGNVGIGINSPNAKLDINQTGGGSGQNWGLKVGAGNTYNYFGNSQIVLSYGGGGGYSHVIKSRHMSAAVPGNSLDFYLWQPGDAVAGEGTLHTMTLDGGNVGIGTTSPSYKLDVKGGAISLDADQPLRGGGRWLISGNATEVTVGTANPGVNLAFDAGDSDRMIINGSTGNVGIGTTTPDSKLSVKGTIHTQEVKVDLNGSVAPDYVFEKDYVLTSLEELKSYIDQNRHLPEIPSAKEMEDEGINLKEMNLLLLKKVEELTLHVIELKKEVNELRNNDE